MAVPVWLAAVPLASESRSEYDKKFSIYLQSFCASQVPHTLLQCTCKSYLGLSRHLSLLWPGTTISRQPSCHVTHLAEVTLCHKYVTFFFCINLIMHCTYYAMHTFARKFSNFSVVSSTCCKHLNFCIVID